MDATGSSSSGDDKEDVELVSSASFVSEQRGRKDEEKQSGRMDEGKCLPLEREPDKQEKCRESTE